MKLHIAAALAALIAAPAIALAAGPSKDEGGRGPDANGDGYLSRAEAQAAADQRFKRLDVDGDGKLKKDERRQRGPWAGGPPPQDKAGAPAPQKQAGGPPPRQDKAGAPGAQKQAGGPPPQGDGGPPPPQEGMMGGHPPMGGPMMGGRMGPHRGPHMGFGMLAGAVFDEYDANKDGALSLSEFRKHALKQFDAQDGNGDGKIKLPERGPQQR